MRDIRGRQNVPPKTQIEFAVRCGAATAELLRPMEPYFISMTAARPTAFGPDVAAPELSANVTLPGMEVFSGAEHRAARHSLADIHTDYLVWIILAAAVLGWLLGIATAVVLRYRTRRRA